MTYDFGALCALRALLGIACEKFHKVLAPPREDPLLIVDKLCHSLPVAPHSIANVKA
ncbi:MAG: hypothetical protein RLZZ399_274 [Verrucomicrobiota bacterium]|jgi:hypothetical protein